MVKKGILLSTTLYFLLIWVGMQVEVRRMINKVHNYLFAAVDQSARVQFAWQARLLRGWMWTDSDSNSDANASP
jgi:hypothetical protein